MSQVSSPVVMVVEDDAIDIEIVEREISRRKLRINMHSERNATEALGTLRSRKFDAVQRENLVVLLDINMPGMNGHQFLDELRDDDLLRRTIVFVLTTSDHVTDKAKAYDRNVAGYFIKSNIEGLFDTIVEYVENVEFPPAPEINA
jgi:CheY-like chemotaxis protein